jgi:small subunit ribosomal protein SAe
MSGNSDILALKQDDVIKMLLAKVHLGSANLDFQMAPYVYKRKQDGTHIINLKKTWEKLLLAVRAICAIENPADVYIISSRQTGQRAALKFSKYIGATPIAGRFTPGTLTNHQQVQFREPRLLIVMDPRADHQPITEASYCNIPVIAFANTDSPLRCIDVAIPCNNKAVHSVGLITWLLAREVLYAKGAVSRLVPWDSEVMVDLFFYREPEEAEKDAQALAEKQRETAPAPAEIAPDQFDDPYALPATGGETDWNAAATAAATAAPAAPVQPAAVAAGGPDNWAGAGDSWE